MKFDRIKWNFLALLWEFLEMRFYFKSEQPFEEYPWFTQIELQKVTAVLNAVSGGDYIVETTEGKKEIEEAFCYGFGQYFDWYTEKQMLEMKKLLNGHGLFGQLGKMRFPIIGPFYEELFRAFEAGHKYITKFDFVPLDIKSGPVFQILNGFKVEKQNKIIYKFNRQLCEAMLILLGNKFRRVFTTAELIEKYGYPNVDHELIEQAKIIYQEKEGNM